MRSVILSVLLMAILLVACAPVASPTAQSFEQSPLVERSPLDMWPPPTTEAPVTPDVAKEENGTGGVVIVYERSGGFAGTREMWRIYADGRVEATSGAQGTTQTRLPDGAVDNAVRRIVDGGFLALADEYMPDNRCCDRFTYKLTVVHDGTVKAVTTMDGVEQPPALAEALAVVKELVQQATSAQ